MNLNISNSAVSTLLFYYYYTAFSPVTHHKLPCVLCQIEIVLFTLSLYLYFKIAYLETRADPYSIQANVKGVVHLWGATNEGQRNVLELFMKVYLVCNIHYFSKNV